MRKKLYCIGIAAILAGCLSGCTEVPRTAQKIVIELSGTDVARMSQNSTQESLGADDGTEESTDGADTSVGETAAMESTDMSGMAVWVDVPQGMEARYTDISAADPVVSALASEILPDVSLQEVSVTDVKLYAIVNEQKEAEEAIPYGEVTFSVLAGDEETVLLYRLDDEGNLVSELLEVNDGAASYQAEDCSHWIVIDVLTDAQESEEPESAAAQTDIPEESSGDFSN